METQKQKHLLRYLDEFVYLLDAYKPSDQTIQQLRSITLVLLVGPTAAGRNTLIDLLKETNRYHSIVSNTTRNPRSNNGVMETDGVEYWFKTEEDFLQSLKKGEYLEAAVIHEQQVSGIHISQLKTATNDEKIAINEVEIVGAEHIHSYKPDTLCIFLLPPGFEVWMERIINRGDIDKDELRRRLESAQNEISQALNEDYYKFVINHEIHEAAVVVNETANGKTYDHINQQLGRNHAEQLLVDIQLYLSK